MGVADPPDYPDVVDIAVFVDCFLQGAGVVSGCRCTDMNSPQPDGVLDSTDVTLFVAALLAG